MLHQKIRHEDGRCAERDPAAQRRTAGVEESFDSVRAFFHFLRQFEHALADRREPASPGLALDQAGLDFTLQCAQTPTHRRVINPKASGGARQRPNASDSQEISNVFPIEIGALPQGRFADMGHIRTSSRSLSLEYSNR